MSQHKDTTTDVESPQTPEMILMLVDIIHYYRKKEVQSLMLTLRGIHGYEELLIYSINLSL